MGPSSRGKLAREGEAEPPPNHPAVLGAVIAGLEDGIVVADADGRIVLSNPSAERVFPKALMSAPAREWPERYGVYLSDGRTLCPPERFPLACAARGESAPETEFFVRNPAIPDGIWISASAHALEGTPGCMMILHEITGRKASEAVLRREHTWATAIVQSSGTMVIVLDLEGRIVSFNHTCELITGYTFEEVRGRHVWGVLKPDEPAAEAQRRFIQNCIETTPGHFEDYWKTKDGRRRVIAWSSTALPATPSGEIESVIAAGIDITDLRRADNELRQAHDMLRAVIETSPLAIVTMDFEGNVKTWNRAAEEMFGWAAHEALGHPFPIVPEEDIRFFRTNLEGVRKGETIAGVERQRRRKDGALVDVALWNAPQRDGAGRVIGCISVIADMTDRKQLEEQFRQAQKMEAVGRLAGGVAHDFNNLLTVITGYTQMMLDGLEEDHPMRSFVEEIVRASNSAATLTNQLLSFSRRQIVSPQVLDLNALVSGMDKMLHRLIGEDIELATVLEPDLPRVKVDAGHFQQVVMNLAVNARDAMPKGGRLTIETSVAEIASRTADGVEPGSYVLLTVADTGTGMSEDTRKRVFEPFFTTKGRGKGTGLGLSTVYGIVKQAGGEVTLVSQPGAGTTFRIYLPALERAVAAGVESGTTAERKKGTETILVVEDQAGLRKLVSEVLQGNGYTVLTAADFREALRMAEKDSPAIHLILTDMVLPGMSGRDLAVRISQLRPQIKVLYMSGHTDHPALSGGAGSRFLQKPFTPESLLAKVREILDAN